MVFSEGFLSLLPPTLHVGGFQPLQKAIHPTRCKPCSGRKLLTVDSPVLPPPASRFPVFRSIRARPPLPARDSLSFQRSAAAGPASPAQ